MLDTIKFMMNESLLIKSIPYNRNFLRKKKFHYQSKDRHVYVVLGTQRVFIQVSLPYLAGGYNGLSIGYEGIQKGLDMLQEMLDVDIEDATLSRIDVAGLLTLSEPVCFYLPCLLYKKRSSLVTYWTRRETRLDFQERERATGIEETETTVMSTRYLRNSRKTLRFYTKTTEIIKGDPFKQPFMKYELSLPAPFIRKKPGPYHIYDLRDKEFLRALMELWMGEYASILRAAPLDPEIIPDPSKFKSLEDYLQMVGLYTVGSDFALGELLPLFTRQLSPSGIAKKKRRLLEALEAGGRSSHQLVAELDNYMRFIYRNTISALGGEPDPHYDLSPLTPSPRFSPEFAYISKGLSTEIPRSEAAIAAAEEALDEGLD